jgi:hypothetical protein
MRHLCAALLLCGCSADLVIAPGEGGGGSAPDPTGGAPAVTGTGGSGGSSGTGGQPTARTIVVDFDAPEGADRDTVVVLVSSPEGAVRETRLGGDLPFVAGVNDGDLVTYLATWGAWSSASMFRVTPEVTEVRTGRWFWLAKPDEPCEFAAPMTVTFEIPQVEGANKFDLRLAGANYLPSSQLHVGTNEAQVAACATTTSFDLVLVAKEYSNTDPVAFARLDDIPYVPGGTATLPIELSSERALVDIVVDTQPGATFGARGSWHNDTFGHNGIWVDTSMTQTVGDTGSASLSYGPFALGAGDSTVSVSVPPGPFTCEIDFAWKAAPVDGTPLHARLGTLAGFSPQADGNVALAAGGEVGDVMIRSEDDYASDTPAYWALHEDPQAPYPLPAKPQVPTDLLPDFLWPGAGAELRYIHEDRGPTEGYADYARTNSSRADGRARHRVPAGCF